MNGIKRPLLEVNRKQAEVPANCEVIINKNGTAPGMWFNEGGKIYISMPGVPHEMMYMMEDSVIPRLKATLKLPVIIHKTILTVGEGESFLAERIADIEDSLPAHIKLAYLPKTWAGAFAPERIWRRPGIAAGRCKCLRRQNYRTG